jgi:hypothetical protein
MEREVGAGRGTRGGLGQAYAASVGGDLLNAQRQADAEVTGNVMQQNSQAKMDAAKNASSILLAQQGMQGEAWGARQAGKAAQKAHGSGLQGLLYRGTTGFASGMGGMRG